MGTEWLAGAIMAATLTVPWGVELTGDLQPTAVCHQVRASVATPCPVVAATGRRCGALALRVSWSARPRTATSTTVTGAWVVESRLPLAAVSTTTAAGVTTSWAPGAHVTTARAFALAGPILGTHRLAASTVPDATGVPCSAQVIVRIGS